DQAMLVDSTGYHWTVSGTVDGDSLHAEHPYLFLLDWDAIEEHRNAAPERDHSPQPGAFAVSSAHPNPFNDAVQLSVTLPSPSTLDLRLYDALGREVETLHTGTSPAGIRQFTWQPTNRPSGIYFVRAGFGNGTSTVRKLVYVR
ncbi:T9SS type A sorting domain-containing protein, partial [bacterium]|nr:T9SS type A sorting domain-containing protein [bacterium]